jgi:hypothetical protein
VSEVGRKGVPVVTLAPAPGELALDGSLRHGWKFADTGRVDVPPPGAIWFRLPKTGTQLTNLQSLDFAFGLPIRLGLDPGSTHADAVSVWNANGDTFAGWVPDARNATIAEWLRKGLSITSLVTIEYWTDWQRASIGVLCLPTDNPDIRYQGTPPKSTEDLVSVWRSERSPAALRKLGPLLSKAETGRLTQKDAARLALLTDHLADSSRLLASADVNSEQVSELLAQYGIDLANILRADALTDWLTALADLVDSVSGSAYEMAIEWSDLDKDEREDARDNLADEVGDLTEALAQGSEGEAHPPSPLPDAQWFTDPTSRHQLRYWDGTGWTEHVSDDGSPSVDPI